jgi:acetyltransferase
VAAAAIVGYPVVLKLHSFTITHKTDVGGVILNLPDASSVHHAFGQIRNNVETKAGPGHFQGVTVQPFAKQEGYELILGSAIDPQFGPVLLFGTGGQLVEVFEDRSLALPPLNSTLARRMMEQTRIYKALKGVRGKKSVDMAELEELMVRFSDLVIENPAIKEIDINPVLASAERLLALDARVVVHDQGVAENQLPRSAIRPYPTQYVAGWTMKGGEQVMIRPIRPEDEPVMVEFHKKLSERSVYLRYFQPLKLTQRTAHERLTRICFLDYDREMALVVERKHPNGAPDIIAVGRLSKIHGRPEAELAAIVQDEFQAKGIGVELYRRLIQVARDEHLHTVHSNMLGENKEMQHLCKKLGFKLSTPDLEDNLVLAELTL